MTSRAQRRERLSVAQRVHACRLLTLDMGIYSSTSVKPHRAEAMRGVPKNRTGVFRVVSQIRYASSLLPGNWAVNGTGFELLVSFLVLEFPVLFSLNLSEVYGEVYTLVWDYGSREARFSSSPRSFGSSQK